MSELDDLLVQVERLGVTGHVHGDRLPVADGCRAEGVCISPDAESFTALVRTPDRAGAVHVDVMTGFGVLSDLSDGAGFQAMWAELVEIDHGE